jgi:haloalkane dehalogenase
VVLNSWMWPLGADPRAVRISRLVGSAFGSFLYRQLNGSPRWLLPSAFADKRKLTKDIHRHYLAPFATSAERTAPWVLGKELTGSDDYYARLWSERAALAEKPLTLVWGERDPMFGTAELERWMEAFPHARVVRLANAGHFPQEEAADEVTRVIAEAG